MHSLRWIRAQGLYIVLVFGVAHAFLCAGAFADSPPGVPAGGSANKAAGEPDAYEPDDESSGATPIVIGAEPQEHTIHQTGDVDWLALEVVDPQDYVIRAVARGPYYIYPELTLLDQELNEIKHDSRVLFVGIEAAGLYFIRVATNSSIPPDKEAGYGVSVVVNQLIPDDYEPDNSAATGTPVAIGAPPTVHNFHEETDADWFELAITDERYVLFETEALGLDGRARVRLYNSSLQLLRDGTPYLRYEFTAPGTYYVMTRHFVHEAYGHETSYSFVALDNTVPPDAYEPDNESGTAGAIALDGPAQRHDFHAPGDLDWVTFDITEPAALEIVAEPAGAYASPSIRVYNSQLQLVRSGPQRLSHVVRAAGTYYVRVDNYSSSGFGLNTEYDLSVRELTGGPDEFEPDDSSAAATVYDLDGPPQSHTIHRVADQDWVTFDLTADSLLDIRAEQSLFNLVPQIALYDSELNQLASGYYGLVHAVATTGLHFVRVMDPNVSRFSLGSQYQLNIVQFFRDAYEDDDDTASASEIELGGAPQLHNFHSEGDEDWVVLTLDEPRPFVFLAEALGDGFPPVLYLYDSDLHFLGYGEGEVDYFPYEPGVYYLKASSYYFGDYGAGTEYELSAFEFQTEPDPYEPDDDSSQAAAIEIGGDPQWANVGWPSRLSRRPGHPGATSPSANQASAKVG